TFSSLSGQRIVTSDPANITVGGLTFDSEARYLIVPPTGNTTNTITLNGSANLNVISSTPGSPSVLVNGHVIAVPLTGSAGLSKSGNGVITLAATNTYTGGTTISSGLLACTTGDAGFGTGSIALSNASIRATTVTWNSARDFSISGAVTFDTFADITTTGVISGGGSLNKIAISGILGL